MKRRFLSKTAPFHPLLKKNRSQNSAVLNDTMGLFLPLDARGRGRRSICSPAFLLSLSFLKHENKPDKTPHLPKF